MRVIAASPAVPTAATRRVRAMNLEMLGLLACSAVVLFGLILAHAGRAAHAAAQGGNVAPVSLAGLSSPGELERLLHMFPSMHERAVVARALYERATSGTAIEHVGGLASVTLPVSAVRGDARLEQLRARADARPGAAVIPVLSSADLAAIKPSLVVRTPAEFNARVVRAAVVVFAAFWFAHLFRRWRRRDDDPVLLPIVFLLCGVGLMAMLALRDPLRDTLAMETFAAGVAAGVLALVVCSEIDFEGSRLRRSVLGPLGAAVALAVLLLVFGSGPGSSGAKVNLLGAQPVEAIRMCVVLALAAFFARRLEFLRAFSEPATAERPWLRHLRLPRWRDVGPVVVSMGLVLVFFFLQKDLGPALVLSCVFLAMYGIARRHVALVAGGFLVLALGFTVAYWLGEPATVRQRVQIWVDPWSNGVPGGNQLAHGLWALSTGALFGNGFGLGNTAWIPAGHTDFILATVGEELGFAGLSAVIVLYAFLGWRCLRTALHAPGDYSAFLSVGVALALLVQALVIASGLLGLVPLSGVVTPFLSYGRSSMLVNCAGVGIVLAIAQRRGAQRMHLRAPVRTLAGVLLVAGAAVCGRAGWVQVARADEIAAKSSLTQQADGGVRFEHNPRLLAAARTLERGTIYDRNGLPLATSRADERNSVSTVYRAEGVQPVDCDPAATRCYPLGGVAFHVVGDWNLQTNWAARNATYVERESDPMLKGYDDQARVIAVTHPHTGRREYAISRDYRELLPLVRQQYWPASTAVLSLRSRERDVHSSLDARLQARVGHLLRGAIQKGGHKRGAAVVLDVSTGEVLASVSYPWPEAGEVEADRRLDRSRYGLYPPGSVFKLLVSAAALRSGGGVGTFTCVRLPDGRVGNFVRGTRRPVRDDVLDTAPHGSLDLHHALVVSCNAYFAQLAQQLGTKPLLDAASAFQLDIASTGRAEGLRDSLAHAGYGQGEVVASPLKIARISAAIAAGGVVMPVQWMRQTGTKPAEERFLPAADAARIARSMRDAVTSGTGRVLKGHPVAIAGKTGTAEIGGADAHSWFTGFAPYGSGDRRIAFAVLIENAGYGARAAAPIAGEIVASARELGLIK